MENSKPIIIVKPGTVNNKNYRQAQRAGYVIMEHPNPEEVKVMKTIIPETPLQVNAIMMASMEAVYAGQDIGTARKFINELNKRLKEIESKQLSKEEKK